VKVGDTITLAENPCLTAIKGFEDVKPMVFAGIYPVDTKIMKNCATPWRNCN
jgi:Membrane GTPase LepA